MKIEKRVNLIPFHDFYWAGEIDGELMAMKPTSKNSEMTLLNHGMRIFESDWGNSEYRGGYYCGCLETGG